MSDNIQKFVVRFPCSVSEKINNAAKVNKRSMNNEIIIRIEHSLANFPSTPFAEDYIEEIIPLKDVDSNEDILSDIYNRIIKLIPYGKSLYKGGLIDNYYESSVIARAEALKKSGLSIREIARILSEEGYKTRKDRQFN